MSKKNLSFEDAMKQLEQIVHELENDEPSLEKALKRFEQGIQLSKYCSEKLDETEKRVTMLLKEQNSDAIVEMPLSDETDEAE